MLKNIKRGAVLALIGVLLISSWTVFTPITVNAAVTTVNINGAGAGRTFDGEGVVSGGGGNSKLLYDYPEPYRSEILDYLFKPNFGASYHELKVEIGADVNSTSGTEPSHARTLAENSNPNMTRGYETWMLREAKNRNPGLITSALEWGAPGWIGNFYSQNNANYLVSYIKGLKSVWGIDLDYIAGNQNESFNGTSVQARDYIVNILRPTLNNNGLSAVKIVAPDILSGDWAFANQIISDPALKSAVAAIGYHYVNTSSTANAQNSGLPIWESEGWTGIGDWNGAFALAKELNLNYINGKMTKTNVWHAIESAYNNTNWAHSGIMEANTPWSGYYIVQPAVWAAAHTNQFAQPGWKYLDSGSGVTAGGTSYVTLKNPANGNYSIIIVSGSSADTITFNLSGGLATTAVHVWKSNSTAQFIQQSDITVSGSSYTINLDPNSIYSLTTTTGQQKGVAAHAIPTNTGGLALPYSDNFEGYALGATPRYTQDTEGAFEVAGRYGGGGNALRQVITGSLLQWNSWGDYPHPSAFTELGSLSWQNYDFSSDVLIENSGGVSIYGRVGVAKPGGNVNDYKGYRLSIYQTGSWYLCYGDAWTYETANDQCLASGTTAGFTANTWHNLKLSFSGSTIKAYIDSNQVANVTNTLRSAGMVGLGSGWNNAQFDNLTVTTGTGPTNLALGKVASADSAEAANPAANGNDGSASTRWCAADGNTGHWWKVDLGSSVSLTSSEVMWEFGGRVYKYKVEVSTDNTNWTLVVDKTNNTSTAQTQTDNFTANARYVRITVTGLASATWASFFEFRVFGGSGGPTPTPTNTPAGPTATPTRTPTPGMTSVNDNTLGTGQNQFNYTGTWSYYASQAGAYQNDNHWSSATNNTYQVAFTGTKVQIYAAKANNHGIFAVSIDNGAETNVDLYAATRADQVLVWTSATLTSGAHTVKVRVTGTKNASSTGTAIVADRVDITP